MKLNESVPLFLEACCYVAYFLVLSLESVGSAPKHVSSTPRGKDELCLSILCFFLVINMFGLLRKKRTSLYTHIFILAKELRLGFVALFRIHVAICLGTMLLFVIVNFFM